MLKKKSTECGWGVSLVCSEVNLPVLLSLPRFVKLGTWLHFGVCGKDAGDDILSAGIFPKGSFGMVRKSKTNKTIFGRGD